jgi:hypothetical protein
MTNIESIKDIENPLVRVFLMEHLDEFVDDVLIFTDQILARVNPEDRSFVQSAGLAFYSAPIVSYLPDLPWQTMRTAIDNAISDVFHVNIREHSGPENRNPDGQDKNVTEEKLIEKALVLAFASICSSTEEAMGTILVGGVAHLLGKYIALCIAGILNEVIEPKSWPIVQVPSISTAKTKPGE